jgi:hypothetical protein
MLNIFKFSLHPWRGLCDLIDRAQRGFDLLEGTEKNWLVVSTPLKNISWDDYSQYMETKRFQTTNQLRVR